MAKRTTKKKEESPLLEAVRFAALTQREDGHNPGDKHCRIVQGWIMSFNGILAVAHPIATELPHVCPNTFQLVKSLERVSDEHAMVFQNDVINIKGNGFKSMVQCIDPNSLPFVNPDAKYYPMNNKFVEAAEVASMFTKEGADRIVQSSVLTGDGTLCGTNGTAYIEVYHGIPTPPNLIIPKVFFDTLKKIKINIVGFGFSEATLTVWFENGAWLKTQLYGEGWPDTGRFAAMFTESTQYDVPKGFFEAIETVLPFAERENKGRFVYTDYNEIRSHRTEDNAGAVVEVKGVPSAINSAFFGPDVLKMKDIAVKIDYTHQDKIFVFGEISRAIFVRAK